MFLSVDNPVNPAGLLWAIIESISNNFIFMNENSQFALWKKWFWIGIVSAALNAFVGLIYGIALALEKERRKEGAIIIVFSLVWFAAIAFGLLPWLIKSGILAK